MKTNLLSGYIVLLLVGYSYGGEIINSPSSETVQPGEFANFTCTVGCTDLVEWLLDGYDEQITNDCTPSPIGLTVCKETTAECDENAGIMNYVETLHVMLANTQGVPTNIALQCASISDMVDQSQEECIPFHTFSIFAVLSVVPPATSEPPTPEPSPTPVVCPSPTTVEVMVTTTVYEPTTVSFTTTEIVTETPTFITTSRASGPRRGGLSVILSELLTWFCTLFAGLLFL